MGLEYLKNDFSHEDFSIFLEKNSLKELQDTPQKSLREKIISHATLFLKNESHKPIDDNLKLKALLLLPEGSDPQIMDAFQKHRPTHIKNSLKREALKTLLEPGNDWRIQQLQLCSVDLNTKLDAGRTLLHDACIEGDYSLVKKIIDKGADLSAKDNKGRTALHAACARRVPQDPRIIALLLEHGADVNAKDENGETPLHLASDLSHLPLVSVLLSHDADANAANDNGSTPLHFALRKSQTAIGEELIKHGADPLLVDNEDKTPLQRLNENHGQDLAIDLIRSYCLEISYSMESLAQEYDLKEYVPLIEKEKEKQFNVDVHKAIDKNPPDFSLLKAAIADGADLNLADKKGETPLIKSLQKEPTNYELVELLLEKGADPNVMDERKRSALPTKIFEIPPDYQMLDLLFDGGADCNLLEKDGMTTFVKAVLRSSDPTLIKYLIDKGGNIDETDNHDRTILSRLLELHKQPSLEIIKLFLEAGADVNFPDNDYMTALHHATVNHPDNPALIKLLLDHGADPNLIDNEDNTPLHHELLSMKPSKDVTELLLEAGTRTNIPNTNGETSSWLIRASGMVLDNKVVSSPFDDEYERRRMLANSWAIKHKTEMRSHKFKLKGIRVMTGMPNAIRLLTSLRNAVPEFDKNMHSLDEIEKSVQQFGGDPAEVLRKFNLGETLIFQTGWRGHKFEVIIHDDHLVVFNRGLGSDENHHVEVFKIDRSSHTMNEQIMSKMLKGEMTEKEGIEFFYKTLPLAAGYQPGTQDLLSDIFYEKCPFKPQDYGNCWWVNIKGGNFMFGIMKQIDALKTKNYKSEEDRKAAYSQVFDEMMVNYKFYSEYTRLQLLKEYIEKPDDGVARDHQLVKKIASKLETKDWKHFFQMESTGKYSAPISKQEIEDSLKNYRKRYNLDKKYRPIEVLR